MAKIIYQKGPTSQKAVIQKRDRMRRKLFRIAFICSLVLNAMLISYVIIK